MTPTGIKKILILDDDADFRKLLATRLGKHFTDVELEEYDPVARGVPGEDFDWSRYDVLLLDYYLCLHGTTGLDILQANRKNLYFPATIMLTGAGNEEVAVRALKAGVHDYLRKEKLEKDKLISSIIEAHEQRQAQKAKIDEQTMQGRAFNKALFYQELEKQHGDTQRSPRILLLINLDNNKRIEEMAGPVLRDNIVRHVARQSYDIFQMGNCNPYVTRFSDTSVALLIDDPGSDKTLEFNLQGLCNHIQKRPYKYEDRKFRFSVSIGVVQLDNRFDGADSVIRAARESCSQAGRQPGNGYHIYRESSGTPPVESKSSPEPDKAVITATQKPEVEKPEAPATNTGKTVAATQDQEKDSAPSAPEKAATDDPAVTVDSPANRETTSDPASGTQPESDGLSVTNRGEQAQQLKQAFDEQRIVQTYQPIISLSDTDTGDSVYYVSLQMQNKDGSVVGPDELLATADSPAIRQHIDRWMLREIMGRIINSDRNHLFLLPLSRESLADASLFNWLRNLLSGFDQARPGRAIALEIEAADFAALQKPAGALMAYLGKTHGFSFVLNARGRAEDAASLASVGKFDFLILDYASLPGASESTGQQEETGDNPMGKIKEQGIQIIVDNIEDSMSLTTAIGMGMEYAMGPFIGEPADQLDEDSNVESFEIV